MRTVRQWSGGQGLAGAGLVILLTVFGAANSAAATVTLAPHRAVYDLILDPQSKGKSVTGVQGRIVQEFSGSPCNGYSNSMRWIAHMSNRSGDVNIDDVRFASWEDEKGEFFQFRSKRFRNEEMIEDVRAKASTDASGGAGKAVVSRPAGGKIALPPETIFPTTHLRHIIQAALAGKPIWQDTVYDVSDDGRKIYATLAVISAQLPGEAVLPGTKAGTRLSKIPAWRVTVGYFNGSKAGAGQGEETPVFEQTFTLYANGVSTGLKLNYGGVVLRGKLVSLDFLDASPCDQSDG
ncbi:MAG: cell envelope integrity EipB family protein [Alphaproteobacteria bacterium]